MPSPSLTSDFDEWDTQNPAHRASVGWVEANLTEEELAAVRELAVTHSSGRIAKWLKAQRGYDEASEGKTTVYLKKVGLR